jgi:hypothetical protein
MDQPDEHATAWRSSCDRFAPLSRPNVEPSVRRLLDDCIQEGIGLSQRPVGPTSSPFHRGKIGRSKCQL